MNREAREEDLRQVSQEEPPIPAWKQWVIGTIGVATIIGLPTILDWLGKNVGGTPKKIYWRW